MISRLTCGSTSSRAILSCSWILWMVSILVPNMCPWKLPYSSSSFPEMPLVIASLEIKKYSSPWASSFRWGLVVSAGKPEDSAKEWPDKTAILLKMGVSTHVVQGRKTCRGIWSIKHFLCASFLHQVHLKSDILIKMTYWRKLNQSPTVWYLTADQTHLFRVLCDAYRWAREFSVWTQGAEQPPHKKSHPAGQKLQKWDFFFCFVLDKA